MIRLATLFSLLLLASALFDDDPELSFNPPTVRNANPPDIRGIYLLQEASGEAADLCPENITHTTWRRITDGTIGLPHNTIIQDDDRCESNADERSLRFYRGTDYDDDLNPKPGVEDLPDDFLTVMTVSTFNSNARAANQASGERYLMGYERLIRVCGGMGKFGMGTTAFLMRPTKADIVIKNLIMPISPGAKYLLMVPRFKQTYCLYSSDINGPDDDFQPIETDEFPPDMSETPMPTEGPETMEPMTPTRPPVVVPVQPTQLPMFPDGQLPLIDPSPGLEPSMSPDVESSPGEIVDDGVCFPADAVVTLESGATKRMDELTVGDSVHVGAGVYSPIFAFTHNDGRKTAAFVTLHTAGHAITATSSHYIYINGRASAIETGRVGDVITLADGGQESVVRVSNGVKTGLYNPQTLHGDIVVDGVRATTYTSALQPDAAHALLAPVRALFKAFRVDPLTQAADWLRWAWCRRSV